MQSGIALQLLYLIKSITLPPPRVKRRVLIAAPAVIPAKAGIQGGEPGGEGVAGFIGWRVGLSPL